MKRYVALLRGVNISGKNKIPMAELKTLFEGLGLETVKTYLNSGNVVFSSAEDREALTKRIEAAIRAQFGFAIPVFVISQEDLAQLLQNAPDWWGNDDKAIYDNLIFIIPPVTFSAVYGEIGAPKEELERIQNVNEAVFWSFSRKEYQKTNWWPKTAGAAVGANLTIRTANTVRKLLGL